jgi:3-deoxy-manno-octulosonate cytidylyltransferase (CMP-KDO synthetase)
MSDNSLSNWLIVVPARLQSTRLPEKPLADLAGKPLIVRVVENLAPLTAAGARIVVATDAEKVAAACRTAGFTAEMTRVEHQSGTDRCAEVAARSDRTFVLNVQGDEPFVRTDDLRRLMQVTQQSQTAGMGTLFFENNNQAMARNPNVVKTLRNARGMAIHFSRLPLPYVRDDAAGDHLPPVFLQHIGVYSYRRDTILEFVKLPPSALEQAEKLEQLRAVEQGWQILLERATTAGLGIDTPDDLEAARARF